VDAAYLHQLRANLDAMRHLPGGTRLPQPSTAEERALLADLVRLRDWFISVPRWAGFDHVMDDRGHRYVVRTSEESVSAGHKSLRGHLPDVFDSAVYERLHMVFYLNVAADATELRFTSHGIMSLTRHPELSDDTSLLLDVHVDPFTWRLVIPRYVFQRLKVSSS
jgi:hypothetical protein